MMPAIIFICTLTGLTYTRDILFYYYFQSNKMIGNQLV